VADRVNTPSPTWHTLFSANRDERETEREVEFLARVLPPTPARVLDVPCGFGRHARGLAKRGYDVTGVELDERVIAEAGRRSRGDVEYVEADMRDLHALPRDFDGVICMWASFGYFDHSTNEYVLLGFAERLRPGGRLVLDVYNPDFVNTRQGTMAFDRVAVTETKSVHEGRLRVELSYHGGPVEDVFEWELYAQAALEELARVCGLEPVLGCCGFDESAPPSADVPRMQLVFERA
jgi:SAM-dependent methyltransferase